MPSGGPPTGPSRPNYVVTHSKHSLKGTEIVSLQAPMVTIECSSAECGGPRNLWCLKDRHPGEPLESGKDCCAFLTYPRHEVSARKIAWPGTLNPAAPRAQG